MKEDQDRREEEKQKDQSLEMTPLRLHLQDQGQETIHLLNQDHAHDLEIAHSLVTMTTMIMTVKMMKNINQQTVETVRVPVVAQSLLVHQGPVSMTD